MDVKQAAKVAKEYVIDLFADEQIEHVGLEEVKLRAPGNSLRRNAPAHRGLDLFVAAS